MTTKTERAVFALCELTRAVTAWSGGDACMGCQRRVDPTGDCRKRGCVVHQAIVAARSVLR